MSPATEPRRPLRQRAFKAVYLAYYRWLYGRRFPGAVRLERAVSEFERTTGRGDAPASRATWEEQWARGGWDFMRDLDELPRYAVIAGLLRHLRLAGSVLDVGCGEGILWDYLRPLGCSRYVGVDVSQEAIARAGARAASDARFVAADAETYSPDEGFDAIVFNESVYYFADPLATVARYRRNLASGGVLVVSTFHSRRADAIARRLGAAYELVTESAVVNRKGTWTIRVFS